ncbi:class I SAM-dependent methyltransferase [Aquimarina macrocephali]|uniref:class I SAM-dependent methyltransferase n=1 Tax=Aquimarina macrocephali TaxID=666563 RepID=UPI003F6613F8
MSDVIEKKTLTNVFNALGKELKSIDNQDSVLGAYFYLKQYEELHEITAALPGNDLLDWGAGYGHFSFVQSSLGKKVHAYSPVEDEYTIYPETLKNLSKKSSFTYELTGEPIALPYEDNSYDIAVSCGVLEHVREFGGDDEKSLSELYRILRNGGCLVIGHLPNKGSWIEAFSRATGRTHHTYLYTKSEIKKKVTDAGFEIKKYKRYGFAPKNTIAVFLMRYNEDSKWVKFLTKFIYGMDKYILSKLFPWFAQNHLLIVQKPK